jgi:hypothetical protein
MAVLCNSVMTNTMLQKRALRGQGIDVVNAGLSFAACTTDR